MNYSMLLENDVILSGLTDEIILNCKPEFIKKIYKTIDDKPDIVIYDKYSSGTMETNENFSDNDIKIMYKFDVNEINKLQKF
jgi:hypothetical protein